MELNSTFAIHPEPIEYSPVMVVELIESITTGFNSAATRNTKIQEIL